MIYHGIWNGRTFNVSVKPSCFTLSLESPEAVQVFSYDWSGRLWTALLDGRSYRRGLDGKMVAKWPTAGGASERRWLAAAEARRVEAGVREQVAGLWAALQAGTARAEQPAGEAAQRGFQNAMAFDAARSETDAARYLQVYKPVGILPPDQYMAVVLQATEGCAFNTCTFCDFYKDRPFRVKKPDEFRAHALAVRDFLGAGLSLRRTIFLGDANALVIPLTRLVPILEIVHEIYEVETLGGMYAFLDGFSAEKKKAQEYRTLAALGLKRVYIGLESGHDPLLKFLKKPARAGEVVRAVQAIKAGGVAVGVIVLLGAGGQVFAGPHVRDTVQALNAMHLDLEDLIYFSELVAGEGLRYTRDAYAAGLQPLSSEERRAQGEQIEHALKFSPQAGVPHMSRYDIREFVY